MSEKMRRDAKNISKTMLHTTHHQNYHPEDDMANENLSNLKLFTCNSHPELAQEIADYMGIELGKSTVTKFSDGEISVSIWESVRGKDCFILQSTNDPVNDHLMDATRYFVKTMMLAQKKRGNAYENVSGLAFTWR